MGTIAYPWCDGHSTSISACEVWEARVGVLNLQEGASHTYTLRLGQSKNSILYKKKKVMVCEEYKHLRTFLYTLLFINNVK